MSDPLSRDSIPEQMALDLCRKVRARHRGRWYSFYAWWCWGCNTFTGGDPTKMCFYAPPDHRGCGQVNRLWRKRRLKVEGS
jgi:hypothetical protein